MAGLSPHRLGSWRCPSGNSVTASLLADERQQVRQVVLEWDEPLQVAVIPITDVLGFAVRRQYPEDTDLARVVNRKGEQIITPIIQFMVEPPSSPRGGVSSVTLRAWVFPRSKERHLFAGLHELGPDDPDAPTPDSLQRWREARKPIQVDFVGDFVYDSIEDRFLDADGHEVTTKAMLDHVYDAHCRTLRARFVWRWNAGSFPRWLARQAVWRTQDGCMWALLKLYDVELALARERVSPFHHFKFSDFVRATPEPGGERSTFFGYVSSRKNLFTNLVILAIAVSAVYMYGPRTGLLRAIYENDALTTAALVLGFFSADVLGQFILKALICGLSRARGTVIFLTRKVRP